MFRPPVFFGGYHFHIAGCDFVKRTTEAIATFGRADVAGKAMQFALGEEHGIFITTPKDFPDPAPEAKKKGNKNIRKSWVFFCWVEVG